MKDGGPAFPSVTNINVPPTAPGHYSSTTVKGGSVGMSLRDWFAGQALIGLLSSDLMPAGEKSNSLNDSAKWADVRRKDNPVDIASRSYRLAQAMVKERERIFSEEERQRNAAKGEQG